MANFVFSGIARFAKRLISLQGWVAEWFKAPVLKAAQARPVSSVSVRKRP